MKFSVFVIGALVLLAINLVIGTYCTNYILAFFGVTIPLVAAVLIGIIGGEIVIPLALIVFILKLCGVHF